MTVHVLAYGQVLCGFSPLPPPDWPEGNRWVAFNDDEAMKLVTCELCRKSLKARLEASE